MKTDIEVEGGELIIQSQEGHYAVIPKKDRQKIQNFVENGCDNCINAYIQKLPKSSDYITK